jgi:hypothetical protein
MRIASIRLSLLIIVAALLLLSASAAFAQSFLVTPLEFDFGNVAPGSTSSPQKVTITNVSNVSQPVTISGGAADVFGGSTTCPGTLAAGASCTGTVDYEFSPTDVGTADRTTSFSINGESVTISFSGTGGATNTDPFVISPRSFNFGANAMLNPVSFHTNGLRTDFRCTVQSHGIL